MIQVVKGVKYNTDTAKIVAVNVQCKPNDPTYIREELYIRRTGEFFLYCEGGVHTKYAVNKGNNVTSGKKIKPLTEDEAKEFVKNFSDNETYEKFFGEISENGKKVAIPIRLSPAAAKKLRAMSVRCRTSMSDLIEHEIKKW